MPRIGWKVLVVRAGLLGAGALAACSGAGESPGSVAREDPRPRRGGTFRYLTETPSTLDPAFANDAYSVLVTHQIFQGLVRFDAFLNVIPSVARTWIISRDGMTYTFELNPGVRFHNGREVQAEDFVYTLTRILDPASPASLAADFLVRIRGAREFREGEAKAVEGLRALGPQTLEIRLAEPYPAFLAVLAMDQAHVVPREAIEPDGGRRFESHPVGTGPFRFLEWVPGERIVLVRNDEFHRGPAWLDTLLFLVPETEAHRTELAARRMLAGKVEMTQVPRQMLGAFHARNDLVLLRRHELSVSFLGFDVKLPPFDNPLLRQAIAAALDRDRMIALAPEGRALPAGILPPGMLFYTPAPKILPHDLARARALLREAGYPEGRGLPELVHWSASSSEVSRKMDEILREDLARIGIRMKLAYTDWVAFDRLITDHEAGCFSLAWIADVPDPDSFFASLFHSRSATNLFRYESATVDSLLALGHGERDPEVRASVYHRIERQVLASAPMIPLFHSTTIHAVSRRVRGLDMSPLGVSDVNLYRVWLEEG
jgi:peptide/nickel transport system substrate-binding protein/oligopeptide transport system substrate-binding protein